MRKLSGKPKGRCDKCKKERVIGLEIYPYYKPYRGKKIWWLCREVTQRKKCPYE
jgi:hypothetical protein